MQTRAQLHHVIQGVGNFLVHRRGAITKSRAGRNDGEEHEGGDHAVFNGGCAALVFPEAVKYRGD